jgi:hypothetical protein
MLIHRRSDVKDKGVSEELLEIKGQLKLAKTDLQKIQSSPVCPLGHVDAILSSKLRQAPIEQLKENNEALKRDREKYQDCMRRWESRKKNLLDTIAREKAEIELWSRLCNLLHDV